MVNEFYPFTKDFTFCTVLRRNKNLCIKLIEIILDTKVLDISYIGTQEIIDINADKKGIRLDVYVDDGNGTVYDLEMQTTLSSELPKRTRYYQSGIDLGLIEKGNHYSDLKKSVIVFICTKDPFSYGLSRYTFAKTCIEIPELVLEDETQTIFLNATGTGENIGEELKEFLDYVNTNIPTGNFTEELESAVEDVNRDEEWRRAVMTLEMRDLENQDIGREKGVRETISTLYKKGLLSVEQAAEMLKVDQDTFLAMI